MLGGGLSAQAQQLPNKGFNNWKGSGNCGSTFQASTTMGKEPASEANAAGLKKRPGDEPTDWNGSNINQQVMMSASEQYLVTKQTDDTHGTYLKLANRRVEKYGIGATAPGYITFGTPWVYACSSSSDQDGGTYGGFDNFKYRPDAIKGKFKRTNIASKSEKAHIIAYLWTGTFTSNIGKKTGGNISKSDVDRAIMGRSNAGTITGNGKLIASVDYEFSNTENDDWEEIIVPLKYADFNTIPEKMNVIVSTADYWDRSNIVETTKDVDGSVLCVDDLEFVYYSTLSALTYDGTNLLSNATTSTDGKTVSVDMSNTLYQAGKIAYTLKGVGASVLSEGYNAATGIYTIQVAGNDNNNGSNVTTYNIQFLPVVNIEAGKTIETTAQKAKVVMTRDFKQGWNTVCLPFATTASALGATKVQQFSAGDDQSVTFAEVANGAIAANTPYLVFFNSAKNWTSSAPFEAVVTLEATSPKSVTHGAFTFSGNYTAGKNMNGLYGVATVDGIQRLRKGNSSATLPAGCAYFTSTSAKANGLAISFDGQTTGIANIDAATDAQTTGTVYNLQGVKVSTNGTAGLPAGIYIQGGRKIIVK